jgi:methionyl aminopeptidase
VIHINNTQEIEKIRKSGQLASQTLDYITPMLKPGLSTRELNAIIHAYITDHGAIPATLGYRGFPASSCISINDEVVHGIPGPRVFEDGDLVKVDVTTILDGFYGDTARTFAIGNISKTAELLAQTTRESMYLAIDTVKKGSRLGDIGEAIQSHVEAKGFSVVREFVGHGVGHSFHTDPNIPHYGHKGTGLKLQSGMVFTIEPMINEGQWQVKILSDKWTAVTIDGKLSAQFEHTILVTDEGSEILTLS